MIVVGIYKPISIYKQKLFCECKENASPQEGESQGEGEDLMNEKEDIHIKVQALETKIAKLEAENNLQRAEDRQRIAELEEYIRIRENSRNDTDILSVKLKRIILKRERGMDYKEIRNVFDFSPQQAYRLMEKTAKIFPFDVEIKEVKNSNKKKKIIIRKGQ